MFVVIKKDKKKSHGAMFGLIQIIFLLAYARYGLGYTIPLPSYVLGLPILLLFCLEYAKKMFVGIPEFLFVLILAYVLIIGLVNQNISFTIPFVKTMAIIIILYISIKTIIFHILKHGLETDWVDIADKIVISIMILVFISSILGVLSIFNVTARGLVSNYHLFFNPSEYLAENVDKISEIEFISRFGGLNSKAGDGPSLMVALSVLLPLCQIINFRNKFKGYFHFYALILPLICFALIFNGRTGLVIASLTTFIYLSVYFVRCYLIYGIKMLPYLFFIASLTFILFSCIDENLVSNVFSIIQSGALRIFYQGSDATLNVLLGEMVYWPDTTAWFLFGSGEYLNPDLNSVNIFRSKDSDIGYVKYIFAYGFFGQFLFILFFISVAWRELRQSKQLFILFVVIIIVCNWKIPLLFFSSAYILLPILNYLLVVEHTSKSSVIGKALNPTI